MKTKSHSGRHWNGARRSVFLLAAEMQEAWISFGAVKINDRRLFPSYWSCINLKKAISVIRGIRYTDASLTPEMEMYQAVYDRESSRDWWGCGGGKEANECRIMALLLCAEMLRRPCGKAKVKQIKAEEIKIDQKQPERKTYREVLPGEVVLPTDEGNSRTNVGSCYLQFQDTGKIGGWVKGQFLSSCGKPLTIYTHEAIMFRREVGPNDFAQNPSNLTDEQVGVRDGWRLLTKAEVEARNSVPNGIKCTDQIQMWFLSSETWSKGCDGNNPKYSYRTKLSPADLAALIAPK